MSNINLFQKISELNPEYIKVEDISKILEIPRISARTLCEMAVSSGVFKRGKNETHEFYILIK